jgi:Fur family transcriptional regulator, peroxide stress response regulator
MPAAAETIARRLDEMSQLCREAGMNVTPQRLAIYRALLEADDHPSPETLHRRIRAAMPSVSLATIYKTFDALERLGLVQEVSVLSATKRYDANMEKHHHLVCTRCKRVVDFEDARLDAAWPAAGLYGFRPQSISVQILGLCASCGKRKRG